MEATSAVLPPRTTLGRRVLWVGACVSPLLLMGAAWWAVNTFVLARAVPGRNATGEEAVRFIRDEHGLPRLPAPQRLEVLQTLLRRAVEEPSFRAEMIAALRSSTGEEQSAFRTNIFDTFKPIFLADIHRYHTLRGAERAAFVDERIVAYNRMGAFFANARVDRQALMGVMPDADDALDLLYRRTTEEERLSGATYLAAVQQRIEEILADAALKAEFERRIAAGTQP